MNHIAITENPIAVEIVELAGAVVQAFAAILEVVLLKNRPNTMAFDEAITPSHFHMLGMADSLT